MDWIGLAQDRDRWRTLVSAVMSLRVPWNAGNFLTSCKPVSCSGRTLHHGVSKYEEHPELSVHWGVKWYVCEADKIRNAWKCNTNQSTKRFLGVALNCAKGDIFLYLHSSIKFKLDNYKLFTTVKFVLWFTGLRHNTFCNTESTFYVWAHFETNLGFTKHILMTWWN